MKKEPLFPLGQVVATPGAIQEMIAVGLQPFMLLARHQHGDWGDLDPEDKKANDRAVQNGTRVFSAYTIGGVRFWVITEADRSSTCILLPLEY